MELFQMKNDLPSEGWLATLAIHLNSTILCRDEYEFIDFTPTGLWKREFSDFHSDERVCSKDFTILQGFEEKLWRRLSSSNRRFLYNLIVTFGDVSDWYLGELKHHMIKQGFQESLLEIDLIRAEFNYSSDSKKRLIRMRLNELYKELDAKNLTFQDLLEFHIKVKYLPPTVREKKRLRTPSAARAGCVGKIRILQPHKEYVREIEIAYERAHQFKEQTGLDWNNIYEYNPLFYGEMSYWI